MVASWRTARVLAGALQQTPGQSTGTFAGGSRSGIPPSQAAAGGGAFGGHGHSRAGVPVPLVPFLAAVRLANRRSEAFRREARQWQGHELPPGEIRICDVLA